MNGEAKDSILETMPLGEYGTVLVLPDVQYCTLWTELYHSAALYSILLDCCDCAGCGDAQDYSFLETLPLEEYDTVLVLPEAQYTVDITVLLSVILDCYDCAGCGDAQDYSFLETLPLEEYDTVLVLPDAHHHSNGNGASAGVPQAEGEGAEGGSSESEGAGEGGGGSSISPASTSAMLIRSIQVCFGPIGICTVPCNVQLQYCYSPVTVPAELQRNAHPKHPRTSCLPTHLYSSFLCTITVLLQCWKSFHHSKGRPPYSAALYHTTVWYSTVQ